MRRLSPTIRALYTLVPLLIAVRNTFRETTVDSSVYDELLVVHPPKRVVGGLTLRF